MNNTPKTIGFIDLSAKTGRVFGNKGAMRTSQKARERREQKHQETLNEQQKEQRNQQLLMDCFNTLKRKV